MDRAQKEKVVASMREGFGEVDLMVVTHQSGLTVAEATDLRRRMRAAGARFKVTKNRLARLALEGTKFADMATLFTGPTAIATSRDPVAAAKVAVEFAKRSGKLTIIGGALDEKILDVDAVRALAALSSLDEVRAKITGMSGTPARRLAAILAAPAGQVARVVRAYSDKGEAA
ncbi:MAG: 50S ribosomal protein L10 [Alphaproteobacteria bacterium]